MSFEQEGITQIEEDELKELLQDKNNDWILIDVRERDEYEDGHIPNIPLIPMQSIPPIAEELDKDRPYLFVCKSGGRSQTVARYLKEQGFSNVNNFSGGMLAWSGEVKTGPEWIVKDAQELT